jgi:hypothetical protein
MAERDLFQEYLMDPHGPYTDPCPPCPAGYVYITGSCDCRPVDGFLAENPAGIDTLASGDVNVSDVTMSTDVRGVGGDRAYNPIFGDLGISGQRAAQARSNALRNPFKVLGARAGGGAAEGLEKFENPLLAMNSPLLGRNVSAYDEGGKLTPAEYKKVAKLGRFGDTQLAHVTPEEAELLKLLGGSGTINPYTGLRENWKWLRKALNFIGFIPRALSRIATGESDQLGRLWDDLTFQDYEGDSKVLQYNEETGQYEQEGGGLSLGPGGVGVTTYEHGVRKDYDASGKQTTGPIGAQSGGYDTGVARGMRGRTPQKTTERSVDAPKVVNPFDVTDMGDKGGGEAYAGDFRWDLENPYIRENVDIFNRGGKMYRDRYDHGGSYYGQAQEMTRSLMDQTAKAGFLGAQLGDIKGNNGVIAKDLVGKMRNFSKGGRL